MADYAPLHATAPEDQRPDLDFSSAQCNMRHEVREPQAPTNVARSLSIVLEAVCSVVITKSFYSRSRCRELLLRKMTQDYDFKVGGGA
jgi:hypothetical protein